MYISRIEIDSNNRRKIKDLNSIAAIHNWVETSFPDEISKEIRSRKLWRIDNLNNKSYLLIVSEIPPDQHLLERYGVKNTFDIKNYDLFLNTLREGQKMRFRVVLNPTKSEFIGLNKRGRTVPCLSIDMQTQYLIDRSEKNGFSLNNNDFYIFDRGFEKYKKKNHKQVRLVKASYEGILTIKDLERFKHTLCKGFGKKKAYGFGMMTVIPVD